MTRKSGKQPGDIRNTGQLFRPYYVARGLSGKVSALHSVVAGSISSCGDHGIRC